MFFASKSPLQVFKCLAVTVIQSRQQMIYDAVNCHQTPSKEIRGNPPEAYPNLAIAVAVLSFITSVCCFLPNCELLFNLILRFSLS